MENEIAVKMKMRFFLEHLKTLEDKIAELDDKVQELQELSDYICKESSFIANAIFELADQIKMSDEEFYELQDEVGVKL
jgi:uncharacterized coiled-coil DUF342 family protein